MLRARAYQGICETRGFGTRWTRQYQENNNFKYGLLTENRDYALKKKTILVSCKQFRNRKRREYSQNIKYTHEKYKIHQIKQNILFYVVMNTILNFANGDYMA